MPCCTLDRTLDTMMKSFSRPCEWVKKGWISIVTVFKVCRRNGSRGRGEERRSDEAIGEEEMSVEEENEEEGVA